MSDPNRFVSSKKKRHYWRPDFGGSWMGPPDDRIWVPGMDWPDGAPPPRDEPDELSVLDTGPTPMATDTPNNQINTPVSLPLHPAPANQLSMLPPVPSLPVQVPLHTPFQPQFGSLPVQPQFAPQNDSIPGYLGGSFFQGPTMQSGPPPVFSSAFSQPSHLAPPPPQYNSLSRGFTMPPLAHDAVLPPHPRRAQREEEARRNLNERRIGVDQPNSNRNDRAGNTAARRPNSPGPVHRRDQHSERSAPPDYRPHSGGNRGRDSNSETRGRDLRGSTYAPRARHETGRGRNDYYRGRTPNFGRADQRSSAGPSNRPPHNRTQPRDEYDSFLGDDDDGAKLYSPRRHPKYRYDSWIPAIVEGQFVPNPSAAETTPRGYPILPSIPSEPGEESDYPSEGSDSEDTQLEKKKSAMIKERNRQSAAVANLPHGSIVPPAFPAPAPPNAGIFGRLSFDQVDDARVLLSWWSAGDESAYYMAIHLITYYGENPAASRPPGIVHLMSNQSNAGSDFVFARTGQHTSLAKLRASASNTITRADRRRARHRNTSRPDRSTTTTTSTSTGPPSVIDTDEVMPAAPEISLASYQPSFLGTSPPTTMLPDVAAGLGPSASLADALTYMERLPPHRWMQGIRIHDGTWPTTSTPLRTAPLIDDVLASRFVLMIAPAESEGGPGGREAFIELVLVGFSLFGLFERFVSRGQWIGASLPLERYPFDARTLNFSLALSWVHQHGISPETQGARALHSFAASWRNRHENTGSPTGVVFRREPTDERSVLNWPDEAITSWSLLQHGQLRPGVTSDYPRIPHERIPRVTLPPTVVPPPASTNDEQIAGPTDESAGPTEPIMEVDEEVEPGEVPNDQEHTVPPENDDDKH
ncbi:hypothetical protein R3P38DRAFT_3194278 [Favolaschia claudopus]|uniref:Uncharacterized protein n=1 Tax=Favolaschia claudopus TaxID=2862362 RepID=A0AAW0BCK1_9AGAR